MDPPAAHRLTRRWLLSAGGASVAALALGSSQSPVRRGAAALSAMGASANAAAPVFVGRPDLRIPPFEILTSAGAVAPGLILLAPVVRSGFETVLEVPMALTRLRALGSDAGGATLARLALVHV